MGGIWELIQVRGGLKEGRGSERMVGYDLSYVVGGGIKEYIKMGIKNKG